MPIDVHEGSQTFHLHNDVLSYVFAVREGYPLSLYFGARVPDEPEYDYLVDEEYRPSSVGVSPEREYLSLEHVRCEVPFSGAGDMRLPALEVVTATGGRVLDLTYRGHELSCGKPALRGLPATYVEDPSEAQTLVIMLADGRRRGDGARPLHGLLGPRRARAQHGGRELRAGHDHT